MKTKATAALTLLLCAIFAIPTAALAGKGGPTEDPNRNPKDKECTFVAVSTRCADELKEANDLVAALKGNTDVFMSRNGEQDAATMICKISGADIKLAQDYKEDEASYLLYKVQEKIWSLEAQGKLDDPGIEELVKAAQDCVDSL